MGLLRLTPTFSPLWTSLWAQLPLLVTGPSRQQDQPSLQRESESEKGRETGDGDANGPGPDDEHRTEAPPPWGGSAGALPTPALHPALRAWRTLLPAPCEKEVMRRARRGEHSCVLPGPAEGKGQMGFEFLALCWVLCIVRPLRDRVVRRR